MRKLVLLLLLLPFTSNGADFSCDQNNHDIKLDFREADASAACNAAQTPAQCHVPIQKVIDASIALRSQLKSTCDTANAIQQSRADVSGQANAAAQTSGILSNGIISYKKYLDVLNQQYNQIFASLRQPAGPLGLPPAATALETSSPHNQFKQKIRAALDPNDSDKVKNLPQANASTVSDITGTDGKLDAGYFAGVNGVNYLKKILKEKSYTDQMITTLSNEKAAADANASKLATQPDPTEKSKDAPKSEVSGGSGLDMKTLAGLATAGAGLAGLMQKKDATSSSTDTSSATSPTPGSTNAADKQGPASSKFGSSDKSASQAPIIGQATPKKDPATTNARTPSGYGYSPSSDISKSFAAPLGTGASSPATSKSGGGGGMAGSFGGAGGAAAANEAEATPASKANSPTGDDTQGIGGGGLGGGGPPPLGGGPSGLPGSDAATPPANTEDSMKDLLHEMKETAEGVNSPELQASATDVVMSDEDIFPRVRAAYVRLQKQGRILDGLSEKVTEENQ